jgi:molybdopterin/thiamine biosynthesis adenylyltransferase
MAEEQHLDKENNEADFFNSNLSSLERVVYDRQFRLQGWHQEILKNSRVLIAGIGGLGCETAKNLAMVGVGRLDLVDMDIIEHSNLNRQVLFYGARMGESKAIAASRELSKINSTIEIVGYHCTLERLDPEIYRRADVIVGGLDSINARKNLNAQAVRFKKPLIDGGVSGYHGHVYTIFPFENACYECYPIPQLDIDDMNACTVVGIPRKRTHCLLKANMAFKEKYKRDPNPQKIEDIENLQNDANSMVMTYNFLPVFTKTEVIKLIDRHEPGIITINAVIASLQSHETVKILNWLKGNMALGEPQKEYVIYNGMTLKFYWIEKPRNLECTQCGNSVRRLQFTTDKNATCQTIVQNVRSQGYELDPEMEATLTVMQFDGVHEIDLNKTPTENGLRPYELITLVGMKGGPLTITLLF